MKIDELIGSLRAFEINIDLPKKEIFGIQDNQ